MAFKFACLLFAGTQRVQALTVCAAQEANVKCYTGEEETQLLFA